VLGGKRGWAWGGARGVEAVWTGVVYWGGLEIVGGQAGEGCGGGGGWGSGLPLGRGMRWGWGSREWARERLGSRGGFLGDWVGVAPGRKARGVVGGGGGTVLGQGMKGVGAPGGRGCGAPYKSLRYVVMQVPAAMKFTFLYLRLVSLHHRFHRRRHSPHFPDDGRHEQKHNVRVPGESPRGMCGYVIAERVPQAGVVTTKPNDDKRE